MDLSCNHLLSGPIAIDRAELGDILVVDVLDLEPHLPESAPDDLPGMGRVNTTIQKQRSSTSYPSPTSWQTREWQQPNRYGSFSRDRQPVTNNENTERKEHS